MILYINTTERDFLKFALIDNKSIGLDNPILSINNIGNKQSENMIFLLNKFLKSRKVKLTSLSKIIVNRGPGSFTSVRIGIVLANTLSYSLKIPIVGVENFNPEKKEDYLELLKCKSKEEFIKPFYYKEANITKPNIKFPISNQNKKSKS
jgi:tRNA threonylcarbamoyl adenosine modification protein YeaZ